ncbi:lipase 2 [Purpureocillium lavendulum]|uniref:Lipase 2 n=1 Tax=Purpureocillium lavendulum TaxID=1247861 RepID=A0AB34FQW7_9HYPO|nr:lipase 2 [Purpureocillium lavendulum]
MEMHQGCHSGPCLCPPHPDLVRRRMAEAGEGQHQLTPATIASLRRMGHSTSSTPGLNDGAVIPPERFPKGTSLRAMRKAALESEPVRGQVGSIVVLVDFPDKKMQAGRAEEFRKLFFSPTQGSVNDYYNEVSGGKVSFVGEVVGPITLPRKMGEYTRGDSGATEQEPNAQTMARDALNAIKDKHDLSAYDLNDDRLVDAFVVVHAGSGAEMDGDKDKFWSLQWNIGKSVKVGDVSVHGFMTIPEDALLGVTVHELGHLVFHWPDLYDADDPSSGLGKWCLMSTGSWAGNGKEPAHPSAWCKYKQGWVTAVADKDNHPISLKDVKDSLEIHRLWDNGDTRSSEYFLIENRQKSKYDAGLPGSGLLVWHVDDDIPDNREELHYKVGLIHADGKEQLGTTSLWPQALGDTGDPFPGQAKNDKFNDTSNPSSRSFKNRRTSVSITHISQSAPMMTMNIAVK